MGDVINWFEITTPEGYYSINDKLGEILASKKGARFIKFTMAKMLIRMKLNSRKNLQPKDKSRKVDLNNPEMKTFLYGMSVKRLISMAGTMGPGLEFKKADVLKINRRLNRIKKEGR